MSYKNSCSWKWRKIHKKCLSLFFKKVARWRPVTLFKKRLHHRSFPENYAKFLKTAFWQNTSWWMLLRVIEVIEIISNVKLVLRCWENLCPTIFLPFSTPSAYLFSFSFFYYWHDRNVFNYLFRNVLLRNTMERNV